MPKRKDRVAPPASEDQWEIRYLTNDAIKGWEDLCRAAPGPAIDCWRQLRNAPLTPKNPRRQHRLKGSLGTHHVDGRPLRQWQYEVTGGGRVWYCPDPERRTVWLIYASTRSSVARPVVVAARVAPYADRHYGAALQQLRVYHALGPQSAWRAALARMRSLAGERQIPADLLAAAHRGGV